MCNPEVIQPPFHPLAPSSFPLCPSLRPVPQTLMLLAKAVALLAYNRPLPALQNSRCSRLFHILGQLAPAAASLAAASSLQRFLWESAQSAAWHAPELQHNACVRNTHMMGQQHQQYDRACLRHAHSDMKLVSASMLEWLRHVRMDVHASCITCMVCSSAP